MKKVDVTTDQGCLAPDITPRPHHRLEELLAHCDASVPSSDEEREWLDGQPAGDELV